MGSAERVHAAAPFERVGYLLLRPAAMEGTALPALTDKPGTYPPSCSSLCRPLLSLLASSLPRSPILSVGSGAGLLEALLLQHNPSLKEFLRGVEVAQVNRFLPAESVITASGTWHVVDEARQAEALMFIYPREAKLLKAYLDATISQKVDTVIWLGPRMDWEEYEGVLMSWGKDATPGEVEGVLEPYERLSVYHRSTRL